VIGARLVRTGTTHFWLHSAASRLKLAAVAATSAFLPAHFDRGRPLALIAGQGIYPLMVAAAARAAGISVRLIAFADETRTDLIDSFPVTEHRLLRVGQLGRLLTSLTELDAGYALMAGQITPRRLFRGLHPDLKAARMMISLKRRNAETIFGAIAREIENLGVHLLDARAFLDEHLATTGRMTSRRFPVAPSDVEHGIHIARECARLDIGQSCVVRRGTVLAVEAFEGTDEILRRAGAFQADGALFVKTVKPGQDWRFDVPCFGLQTLETMRRSGIAAAALAAGQVLMLDKPAVLRQAETWKIALTGFA